jgi:hypothetical protein
VTVEVQWDEAGQAPRILDLVHPYWVDRERLHREDEAASKKTR